MNLFLAGYVHLNHCLTESAEWALARTDFAIPMQTIVSMSARLIHDNPDLFPAPGSFDPDRWLGEKGKELEHWNVAFSKGERQCIGRT